MVEIVFISLKNHELGYYIYLEQTSRSPHPVVTVE